MHSFWNLFKAEFAAHTLYSLLFSGKYPKIAALMLVLLFSSWYLCRGVIRVIYHLLRWAFATENMAVRKRLRYVIGVGKPFGDTSEGIRAENRQWVLVLRNPNFRQGVEKVEFRVARKTGQLTISVWQRDQWNQLGFTWLQQIMPRDRNVSMHYDFSAYIYYHLRLNVL